MHVEINGEHVPTWVVILCVVAGRFVWDAMKWAIRRVVKRG